MSRRKQYFLVFFGLALCQFTFAGQGTWTGDGPFPAGTGRVTVHALAIDPATGTLYAGTGSGTVLAYSDSHFSEPPVAADDQAQVHTDGTVDIDVLGNDYDPEGALVQATVAVQIEPAHGTTTLNADGIVTYTADASFAGRDSFTYTVKDRAGTESAPATVTLIRSRLSTSPGGLDFGEVRVGDTSSPLSLTLKNTGTADLTVTGISAATAPFARTDGGCGVLPFTLTSGAECTLRYTFVPVSIGPATQAIMVTHGAPASPHRVDLSGVGIEAPVLSMSHTQVSFGELAPGAREQAEVSLTNSGGGALHISRIGPPNPPFDITRNGCAVLSELLAGESCAITLEFSPDQVGQFSDALVVMSNAASSPDEVRLSGSAAAASSFPSVRPVPGLGRLGLTLLGVMLGLLAVTRRTGG